MTSSNYEKPLETESFKSFKKEVLKEVEKDGLQEKNYIFTKDFAFYVGSPVNYVSLKVKFVEVVGKVFIEEKKEKKIIEEENTTSIKITTTTSTKLSEIVESLEEGKEIKEDDKDKEETAGGISEKIGVFLNLNGTSATRKNYLKIRKIPYLLSDLTALLGIKNRAKGRTPEKEKTDREVLTVERIAMCYVEETVTYLKANPVFSKIPDLAEFGFTKSFYCNAVIRDEDLATKVYKSLRSFEETWQSGKITRFSEKMKKYYQLILKKNLVIFKERDK